MTELEEVLKLSLGVHRVCQAHQRALIYINAMREIQKKKKMV